MARSARGPVVAMVVVALVPVLVLGTVWRWADGLDAEPDPSLLVPPTPIPTGPPTPELSTTLVSLRRLPEPIAVERADAIGRAARAERLAALLDELPSDVAQGSCARVELDGEVLADLGADLTVTPASTLKLLIAAAALDTLDPDSSLVTELRGPAPVEGVVQGDVYLVGGGDPLVRSDEVPIGRSLEVVTPTRFDDLVDQLAEAGVRRIDGDLVGDGDRYDDEFIVPTWGEGITRDDGGPIGALLVNDGRIVGSGVGLNPSQSAVNELARLLSARQVAVVGGNRTGSAPADAELLATIASAPIGSLVEEMLVTSDNQIAEMLLKEIGYVAAGEGTRPAGMAVVREILAIRGVDLTGAVLTDGSGLSRENELTCRSLVDLLASDSLDGPLSSALPVSGERGTLTEVLVDGPAEGLLRAKTGTLTGVKGLAGWLPIGTTDGAAFAVLLEGPGANEPAVHEPVWEAMIDALLAPWPEPDVEAMGPR